MTSDEMIYEGMKKHIDEWIEIQKLNSDFNYKNGWSFEQNLDEAETECMNLEDMVEGLLNCGCIEDFQHQKLSDLVHDAYEEAEDYILSLYEDVDEEEEAV